MTTEQIVIAGSEAVIARFAYDALDSETRIVVQQKTGEIRERVDAMQRSTIEIGQRLREVKARLKHGEWGDWLQSEFRWSDQTALNMINVAVLAEQTPKILEFEDRFAKSALTAIAAPNTPPAARQAALELAESGEKVTSAKAQQLIAEHKPQPPDDGAPHLPPDFAAAQARAHKISLYISMNGGGRFTLTYETGLRAVAGTGLDWQGALNLLTTLGAEAAAPPPAQATLPGVPGDKEIAGPVLTPAAAPAPTPLIPLTPLTPAVPAATDDQTLIQAAAMLLYCRKLVALAQHAWDAQAKPHLDANINPVVQLDEAQAESAARMAILSPAMRAQAGMLTFGASVTMQRWDEEASGEEEIAA
jgi:hypothetical protein